MAEVLSSNLSGPILFLSFLYDDCRSSLSRCPPDLPDMGDTPAPDLLHIVTAALELADLKNCQWHCSSWKRKRIWSKISFGNLLLLKVLANLSDLKEPLPPHEKAENHRDDHREHEDHLKGKGCVLEGQVHDVHSVETRNHCRDGDNDRGRG
jgi:hypothetical protein